MIVIEISLWPHGDHTKAKTLVAGVIANDGTGDAIAGNYNVVFGETDGPNYEGRVEGHWRGNRVLDLVYKAIRNLEEVEDGPE